jgi:anti-sigma factor RsiW
MDHDLVVRQQMTERYLLGELDPEARDEFEEHFFDCPDCAVDVRAGALFVEHSKIVLAEESEAPSTALRPTAPLQPKPGWLPWLRPVLVFPVMVLLLGVIGYQNLVTYPELHRALNSPEVLPFAFVNVGTMGSDAPVISAHPGEGFVLFVRITPDGNFSKYTAELYNPAGKQEWSVPIPSSSAQDQWPVRVPAANREAGTYIVVLRGLTVAGESKEVGRGQFELQIEK